MAIQARRERADALLVFPERNDPVEHHRRLTRELPGLAFWLYEAAGGVAYDDDTLHRILALPTIIGIKVATLDSVMTFQRLAAWSPPTRNTPGDRGRPVPRLFPDARRQGGADRDGRPRCPDLQARLLQAHAGEEWADFHSALHPVRPVFPGDLRPAAGGLRAPHALGAGRRGGDSPGRLRRSRGARRSRSGSGTRSKASSGMRAQLERDFERFGRDLPAEFAAHVRDTYRIDLTSRYLRPHPPSSRRQGIGAAFPPGGPAPHRRGRRARLCVLKTVIAQDAGRSPGHGGLGRSTNRG